MIDTLVKKEIQRYEKIFEDNEYDYEDKKLFLEAKEKIALSLDDEIVLKACEEMNRIIDENEKRD